MKKLMMAAAIVCAAVAAQAGSAKWALYDVASPDAGYAYLFNSADVAVADIATVLASISEGTFATKYAAKAANETAFEEGGLIMANAIKDISGATTLWMIGVDDATDPTMAFVGDPLTQTIGSSGSKNFYWYGSGEDMNTSGWQSVPEPTSGLLLLLGVAGLALRRRRA